MKEKNKFNSAGPGIVVSASCSGNKNEIILQKKLKMTEEILYFCIKMKILLKICNQNIKL